MKIIFFLFSLFFLSNVHSAYYVTGQPPEYGDTALQACESLLANSADLIYKPPYCITRADTYCVIVSCGDGSSAITAPITYFSTGCPSGYVEDGANCIIAPVLTSKEKDCAIGYAVSGGFSTVDGCSGSQGEPQPPSVCISGTANCFYSSDSSVSCSDYPDKQCYSDDGWVIVSNELITYQDEKPSNYIELNIDSVIDSSDSTGGSFIDDSPLPSLTAEPFSSSVFNNTGDSGINVSDFQDQTPFIAPVIETATDGTISDLANVSRSIYKLLEDERANELRDMLRYLNSTDRSQAEILQYQQQNYDKYVQIRNELGLSRLNDEQFYDLIVKKGDFGNDRLIDIYRKIDWGTNELLVKHQGSIDQLIHQSAQMDSLLDLESQINDDSKEMVTTANELLVSMNENQRIADETKTFIESDLEVQNEIKVKHDESNDKLDQIVESLNRIEPISCDPLLDPDCSVSDGSSSEGQVLLEDSLIDNSSFFDFINDMGNSDLIQSQLKDFESLFPELPEPGCSGSINDTIFGRPFVISPCDRLAPLRTVLAWVFGLLVFKTSFYNLFHSKG